jgi:hypothetical protein
LGASGDKLTVKAIPEAVQARPPPDGQKKTGMDATLESRRIPDTATIPVPEPQTRVRTQHPSCVNARNLLSFSFSSRPEACMESRIGTSGRNERRDKLWEQDWQRACRGGLFLELRSRK